MGGTSLQPPADAWGKKREKESGLARLPAEVQSSMRGDGFKERTAPPGSVSLRQSTSPHTMASSALGDAATIQLGPAPHLPSGAPILGWPRPSPLPRMGVAKRNGPRSERFEEVDDGSRRKQRCECRKSSTNLGEKVGCAVMRDAAICICRRGAVRG